MVRPPIVFGEGDRDVFNLFKGIARTGIHAIPSLHDYFFSAMHARDLSIAMHHPCNQGDFQLTTRRMGLTLLRMKVVTYMN